MRIILFLGVYVREPALLGDYPMLQETGELYPGCRSKRTWHAV